VTEVMERTPEELRSTAYHEAGHAVIHRVVGMLCGGVTIEPDYEEMTAGVAIVHDPWAVYSAWERRGKQRGHPYESVLRGRIMGYMAGREAIIAFGTHHLGDGDDLRQIALMADEAGISEAYLDRLRPKVRALLRRHWPKVERVAEALLDSRTLTGEEIDALIDSVTTATERDIAARIETVRQPLRDWYAFMRGVLACRPCIKSCHWPFYNRTGRLRFGRLRASYWLGFAGLAPISGIWSRGRRFVDLRLLRSSLRTSICAKAASACNAARPS
jgi:hypothetical protein